MSLPLIRDLPQGALDIVGDVHGESEALDRLLSRLGYRDNGTHPEGRMPVFMGDLIDRGPDSPAVVERVREAVYAGRALALLGNHELNLLAGEIKEGSGWFFPAQTPLDAPRYGEYRHMNDEGEKERLFAFLNSLPAALERDDLRLVHAAWIPEKINQIKALGEIGACEAYRAFESVQAEVMRSEDWYPLYLAEIEEYRRHGRDPQTKPEFLNGICAYDLFCNQFNPLRTITAGVEKRAGEPFFAAGRWRFTTRDRWWLHYRRRTTVVVGHYWRQWRLHGTGRSQLFPEAADMWLGDRNNVFCVDYSVGARWRNRIRGENYSHRYRLAALRLPEKTLVFDDGEIAVTRRRPRRRR